MERYSKETIMNKLMTVFGVQLLTWGAIEVICLLLVSGHITALIAGIGIHAVLAWIISIVITTLLAGLLTQVALAIIFGVALLFGALMAWHEINKNNRIRR